jgi:peptide deformylase
MNIPNDLKIVPLDSIPSGQECSFGNLPELYKLGLLMQAVCDKEKGIGLSAVQLGIPSNFFVLNYGQDNYRFFANCTYSSLSEDKEKYIEGCLSIKSPDGKLRHFEVERFKNIMVKGKELTSNPILEIKDFELTPTDYYKIVFQHEIDHASLITIDQIGKEVFLWNK